MPKPKVVSLSVDQLQPHPLNPRGPITAEGIADLKASMQAHGQKQPCVVMRREGEAALYFTVIGHRRVEACRALGIPVLAIIEDLDDDEAVAIMVSDNEVREDVDPFLEAKAVGTLLGRPGWTLRSVADALGKSISWVARRSNLAHLSPKIRPIVEKAGWPLDWLEDLAKLDRTAQEKLAGYPLTHIGDREDLNRLLARELQVLGKAPWKLDDETLLPKAGSCAACPKTSLRAPGLFDAGEDIENQKHGLQKAVCRDSACWAAKGAALVARTIDEGKASGAKVVVVASPYSSAATNLRKDLKDLPLVEKYEDSLQTARKGSEGAVLAVVVGADGKPTGTRWTKDPTEKEVRARAGKERAAKAKEVPPAERLKASKERIATRRIAHVLDAFAGTKLPSWHDGVGKRKKGDQGLLDRLAEKGTPSFAAVLALVSMFEVEDVKGDVEWKEGGRIKCATADPEEWAAAVWLRVKEPLRRAFQWGGSPPHDAMADRQRLLNYVLVSVLGETDEWNTLVAKALDEIPDPKSWASLEAQVKAGKGKKAAPAKGKKPAKASCWCRGRMKGADLEHREDICGSKDTLAQVPKKGTAKASGKKGAKKKAAKATKAKTCREGCQDLTKREDWDSSMPACGCEGACDDCHPDDGPSDQETTEEDDEHIDADDGGPDDADGEVE